MIEPLADRSARMDEGELFGLIARFFDERCLQRVEDHAERRRRGRALRVPFVRLAVDVLLEHDVRCLRQRRGNDLFGWRFSGGGCQDNQQYAGGCSRHYL